MIYPQRALCILLDSIILVHALRTPQHHLPVATVKPSITHTLCTVLCIFVSSQRSWPLHFHPLSLCFLTPTFHGTVLPCHYLPPFFYRVPGLYHQHSPVPGSCVVISRNRKLSLFLTRYQKISIVSIHTGYNKLRRT